MPKMDLGIFALDADDCVYGIDYQKIFTALANRFYSFFQTYGSRDSLTAEEQQFVSSYLPYIFSEMREAIKHLSSLNLDTTPITGEFSQQVNKYFVIYKKIRPGSVKNYPDARGFVLSQVIDWLQKLSPELYNEMLIAANESLIQFICTQAKKLKHSDIIIASNSNRNAYDRDQDNKSILGTGLFIIDIEVLHQEIAKRLSQDINVHLVPFIGADLKPTAIAGLSAAELVKFCLKENMIVSHNTCVYDVNKLIQLYALVHHIFILPQFRNAVFKFYDVDNDLSILKQKLLCLEEFPSFLPQLIYTPILHPGTGIPNQLRFCACSGIPDKFYVENAKLMIAGCPLIGTGNTIDSAKDLNIRGFLNYRDSKQAATYLQYSSTFRTQTLPNSNSAQHVSDNAVLPVQRRLIRRT